jgi:hypothetical protein
VENLQHEIMRLRSRLRYYEDGVYSWKTGIALNALMATAIALINSYVFEMLT